MYFALRLLNPLSDVNNQLTSGVWHVKLTKEQKNYLKTQTNNENTSEFNDERLMYVTIYKHKSDESKSHWFLSALEYINSTEITFELFCNVLAIDALEPYVLPYAWCMEIKGHEDVVREYLMSIPGFDKKFDGSFLGYLLSDSYQINDQSYMWWGKYSDMPYRPTEITFEQFKQYVLKENTIGKEKPVEKELIGYKLKDQKYEKAAVEICKAHDLGIGIKNFELDMPSGISISDGSAVESWMRSAGVLDLWFEPVYKEQFQKGDWVIGESNGCIYVGLYSNHKRMSEWMPTCTDTWIENEGEFEQINRLATPEEIKEAKKYKYKAKAEAMFAKVDAEIERLLEGIKPKENINSNQVMFSREIPMDLCLGDKTCMSWEIYAAAHKLLK